MQAPFVRPLPRAKIQPHNTALLVIDMERDFLDAGAVQETPGGRALEGTDGCALVAGLDVRPEDHRIVKRRYDSFFGTDLDLLLRARGSENLVCCGVTTHVCVMSTVFTARNHDYRVLVPADAVAAISPDHQAAALLCMSDVFAYVTTSAEVRMLWESV
jgi:nicotinamidase-related amidase